MHVRDTLFYKLLYARCGFIILPGAISAQHIDNCFRVMATARPDEWSMGDDSIHAWDELARREIIPLADIIELDFIAQVLGRPVSRSYQWINRYRAGEHIGEHSDAGGDAHLLAGIQIPPGDCGGQLWLGSVTHILPVGAGDAVLFDARTLLHGTTPVSSGGFERITLNSRIWLE